MAAGQGFKTFTSGEVLTAADVNGYLMQGVGVFTDAANRDAEITSPQEGQFAYLKDTNVTTYYTGSAWANLDTTGMTNPMTTTGDTIYSSSGSTPARLGIGSTGQVLTVSAGIPAWSTPAGGGANWTLLNAGGTALTGAATITVSGISGADKIAIFIDNASSASSNSVFSIRFNTSSASNYNFYGMGSTYRSTYDNFVFRSFQTTNSAGIEIGEMSGNAGSALSGYMIITGCNASGNKVYNAQTGVSPSGSNGNQGYGIGGYWNNSAAITSVSILSGTGNFDDGNIRVYTSA
jgi:hypothetical protein